MVSKEIQQDVNVDLRSKDLDEIKGLGMAVRFN